MTGARSPAGHRFGVASVPALLAAAGTALAQAGMAPAAPAVSDAPWLSVSGVETELNIRAAPTVAADVVDRAPAGTLLRNLGCVPHPDRIWCEVAPAGPGGPGGWAAAEFLGPADSALRAGQGVHDEIGRLPCTMPDDRLATECDFGAARDPGGSATVVVTRPDGMARALFFVDGAFLSTDASEALGGFDSEAALAEDGTFDIRIDDETYSVPRGVVLGRGPGRQ
jgi:hypothetical protein